MRFVFRVLAVEGLAEGGACVLLYNGCVDYITRHKRLRHAIFISCILILYESSFFQKLLIDSVLVIAQIASLRLFVGVADDCV